MQLSLPALDRSPLPTVPTELVRRIDAALSAGGVTEGYVQVQQGAEVRVLFLHKGKTYCAGRTDDGRFGALALTRFFSGLPGIEEAELCVTDLVLFLCTAVLFRKAPAAQIPASLVDSATILDQVKQTGRDAVLVIRRGEARSLAFCREGVPQALYPAPGESFPEGASVTDRIVEYIYADAARPDVSLDLYDEISLPPAPEAGKPLSTYRLEREDDGPEISIVVRLGDRIVFGLPMSTDEITVGRGGDNELALDNLSVSRRHARVKRVGEKLEVSDLGSENGLVVGGKKVKSVTLGPGDQVGIGRYTLQCQIGETPADVRRPPKPERSMAASVEETIAIQQDQRFAVIEHEGQRHRMGGWVFTIGKKPDASLRIRGFGVAPIHVRVNREPDGSYRIERVGGMSSIRLNGKKVDRAALTDGDEFAIGGKRFRFRLEGG